MKVFKEGDRVRVIGWSERNFLRGKAAIGDTGTVRHVFLDSFPRIGVVFDRNIGGHTLHASPQQCRCPEGYGYYVCEDEIELIEEGKPMIDTPARDSVAQALRECKEGYADAFDKAIDAISKAERPEQVMAAKKDLLVCITMMMPLTGATCYFCKTVGYNECDYAKHHGKCLADGSTWGKIFRAYGVLVGALRDYYKGESYTDPEREKRYAEYQRLRAEFEPGETA